jgi:hypothetical protein
METQPEKPIRHVGIIPRKEADIRSLLRTVLVKWKANPAITLLWTNPDKLEQQVNQFEQASSQRMSTGAGRPIIRHEIRELDKAINTHMAYLKIYIMQKYGKELQTSYYPQFGLVKVGRYYKYPADRNLRSQALALTLLGIVKNGFSDEKYGIAFWQPIKTRYDELMKLISETDSIISRHVGDKKPLRREIVLTLNALIHILKGNYPKTWKIVLREWGFQKEKY